VASVQDNALKALGRVPDIAEDDLVAVLKAVLASGAEGALDAYVGRLAAYPVTRGPLRAALRAQLDADEITRVLEVLDSRVGARDGLVLAEVSLVFARMETQTLTTITGVGLDAEARRSLH
jgi:hypothetical protein